MFELVPIVAKEENIVMVAWPRTGDSLTHEDINKKVEQSKNCLLDVRETLIQELLAFPVL